MTIKVGLIFECGPQGADRAVCEHLTWMLNPDIEISPIMLDNKPKLVQNSGQATVSLLAEGCERVLIIWDLYPPWRDSKPCRKEDRENIMQSLAEAGVNSPHVYLVCLEEELEAWLLADERAIEAVLSRPAHKVKVPRTRRPEQIKNPKKQLNRIFQQNRGRRYHDLSDAQKIVKALPNLKRLKRCATFVRFAVKVTGKPNILR